MTASKFSGSDTEIEENVDITEVDEDYCTINDQIVQTCFFFITDQINNQKQLLSRPTEKIQNRIIKAQKRNKVILMYHFLVLLKLLVHLHLKYRY